MTLFGEVILVIFTTLGASTGFWAFVQRRDTIKDATGKLLMGIAYDRITYLGMRYIERGWVSKDEYEDYRKYFYDPYKALGGNGTAERIMGEISTLPIIKPGRKVFKEIYKDEEHLAFMEDSKDEA